MTAQEQLTEEMLEELRVLDESDTAGKLKIYEKYAAMGSYEAFYFLATHYRSGIGVDKDIGKAYEYMRLAYKLLYDEDKTEI